MRVTVQSPGYRSDVEVDDGVTVSQLRDRLAALTGDAGWHRGTPTADGDALHDDHPAGRPPLRHGATLRQGRGPVPEAVAAARAAAHVAVVGGPDSGRLLVPDGRATLGPGGDRPVDDDGRWLVRVRPGRHGRLLVRRATGRASLARAGRRRVRVLRRWRWTRWRPGEELRAGPSTLELRTRDQGGAAAQGAAAPVRTRRARWLRAASRLLPAVASAGTAAAIAISMRQPVLLLGALSALVLLGPRPDPPLPGTAPPDGEAGERLDLAGLRVRLAAGTAPARPVLATPVPWDGELAVAGPREPSLRLARALLLSALAGAPAPVTVLTDRPGDWSWLSWFGRPPAGSDAPEPLVVLDGAAAARWHPGARVLRLVGDQAPPWCGQVVEVHRAGADVRPRDGSRRGHHLTGVSADVAEAVARALGGPRPALRSEADDVDLAGCPADVVLGALPGIPAPDPRSVAAAWAAATAGASAGVASLPVSLGAGPGGAAVTVDLVADGPHALIAGTTGSGKSELLSTLVLGLALTQPPERLAVVLVDFKGGTGLPAPLARLPHVAGHLSDLDAAGTRRTVRGLFAELRRRERILAAHGATDVRDLDPADPATPPRLLVVIDEFRALADDLPDLLPGLARLAAQGRSLGVHLVLATQRPSGAVPADLRANVGLRVALRVTDPGDSVDLVGVGDAARARRPGLAVLARGAGRAEAVQVARALPRSDRPVRLAEPWAAGWAPASAMDAPLPSVAAWVGAAVRAGGRRAPQPWLPPLPGTVHATDVPPGAGLPLALADLPDDLARGPVRWDPDRGHLLVAGGPGSGRSTALAAVAAAALAAGRTVHCVGVPEHLLPEHPRLASRLAGDDVTRVARLVRMLSRPAAATSGGPRPLLVLDDAPGTLAALGLVAHGAAADLLTELWGAASGPAAVAASGGPDATTGRLVTCFADRLVLGSPDQSGDALLGVPGHLAGPRPEPGRAIHVGRGEPVVCQVALPAPVGPRSSSADSSRGQAADPTQGPAHVRVLPLPALARRPATATPTAGAAVAIGLGGDDAGPVLVGLDRPLLVTGPPGSGRTTALAAIAAGAVAAGLRVANLGEDGPPDDPEVLLVVDDLDDLEARRPAVAEALAARLAGAPLRLVAATTTAHAVSAYHGPVPALVRSRRLLVLDPAEPGGADLLGAEGAWLVDHRRRQPGRGALRLGREVVPVQVWAPDDAG